MDSDLAEHLTTGWEPGTPVEDGLLRRFLFHFADQCAAVAVAGGGRALAGPGWAAADLGRPGGYWNGAVLLQPPHDWSATLDEVEAYFDGSAGAAMLWSAWPTPDLRLRGWVCSGHPPMLVRPPDALAPVAGRPSDARVDVRPVRDEADLVDWERAAIDGYPLPDLQPARPGALLAPALLDDPRHAFWVGRVDGLPVSASASFVSRGIASLAFGATLPGARGQGHWHRHAVERLRRHPDLWTAGVFSDHSRPLAERIGFVPVLRLTLWVRPR